MIIILFDHYALANKRNETKAYTNSFWSMYNTIYLYKKGIKIVQHKNKQRNICLEANSAIRTIDFK